MLQWKVLSCDKCSQLRSILLRETSSASPEGWLFELMPLATALEVLGPTIRLSVPSALWLRAPLMQERSIRVSGNDRHLWLPWTVHTRMSASPLPPVCTVWVPEERDAPLLVDRCAPAWTPTGEAATYMCADAAVHAVAVRRATPRPNATTTTKGRAREAERRR